MTKAIMMSIQPKWVEKILNGEKTIEVRKTMPKLATPFKVYIYCTKGGEVLTNLMMFPDFTIVKRAGNIYLVDSEDAINGKVVAEFTCDRIDEIDCSSYAHNYYSKDSCLSADDFIAYCNGQDLYAWYISDLKIYDKPRELGEFHKIGQGGDVVDVGMKRPFQSWGYVEEIGNEIHNR